MHKTILKLFAVLLLIALIQACAPAGAPTPDINVISTGIARTLTALAPTSGPGIPVTGDQSPTPAATMTMTVTSAPTETAAAPTATQALSPTPLVLSTSTATAIPTVGGGAQIQVSVATNCRLGPGTAYQRVGALQVGQVADVVGRNAAGTYWIIRNPVRTSQTCWLWGEYATLSGNTDALPVLTPPTPPATATPAADFDVFYDGLERCADTGWWVEINLENLGGLTFRSMSLSIEDRDTDDRLTQRTDGFPNANGCDESNVRATLAPRANVVVSSPVFDYDPTGHRLRATITLCSERGRSGTCVTDTVNLRP